MALGLGAGWQDNEHRAHGIGSAVLGEHCARLGWDPAEIERSSVALLFLGEPVVPQP